MAGECKYQLIVPEDPEEADAAPATTGCVEKCSSGLAAVKSKALSLGCVKRCARGLEAVADKFGSIARSPAAQYLKSTDTQMKGFASLTAASYYIDIALDAKQIYLFLDNKQYVYLGVNCAGIFAGVALDVLDGGTPLVGPARLLIQILGKQHYLPHEPTEEDMRQSARRFKKLKELCGRLGKTSLVESCVESATSLLIQGFALGYESYTENERFWLAVSVIQGVCTTAWALCSLDDESCTLRSVEVQARGAQESVPVVCGSLTLGKRVALMLARVPEVAARMGSILTLLVSIKIAHSSVEEETMVRFASGAVVLGLLLFDTALFKLFGSPGAWRRSIFSLLALASPASFPSRLPGMGPQAWIFHASRHLQTLSLMAGSLWARDWDPTKMRADRAVEYFAGHASCHQKADARRDACEPLSELIAAATVVCFALHLVINTAVLVTSPKDLTLRTRSAWADLIGSTEASKSQDTGIFPEVPEAERALFERYGLLPPGGRRSEAARPEPQGQEEEEPVVINAFQELTDILDEVRAAKPGLRWLCIMNLNCRDAGDWEDLLLAVRQAHASSLQKLTIHSAHQLNDASAEALAQGLSALGALLDLELICVRLEPSCKALWAQAVPSLQRLLLKWCDLGDEGMAALAESLGGNRALQSLSIEGEEGIEPAAWRALVAALGEGPAASTLQSLRLVGCNLDDEKLCALVEELGSQHCAGLPEGLEVDLTGNRDLDLAFLSLVRVPGLRGVLRDPPKHEVSQVVCPSEALWVRHLTVKGARGPAAWIGRCCRLETLEVQGGPGTEEADLEAFAAALGDGPSAGSLRELRLTGLNWLNSGSFALLAPALPASLQILGVTCQRLGAEGMRALAQRLPALPALRYLDVGHTGLVEEGAAESLARGLAERARAGGARVTVHVDSRFEEEVLKESLGPGVDEQVETNRRG